jgi:hypothetical protein
MRLYLSSARTQKFSRRAPSGIMVPMGWRWLLLGVAVATTSPAAPPGKGIAGPREDDCPELAPPSTAGPDLALIRGLLWAFEPAPLEIRVLAIEDLGFLGDPRSLNPLSQLCLDPNPLVARAALRAVAAIRHPRAEEILANVARHPLAQESARQRALELLPFQNTWSSLQAIHQLARAVPVTSVVLVARRLAAELPAEPAPPPATAPLPGPAPSPAPATGVTP